jgi:hypothetical protein
MSKRAFTIVASDLKLPEHTGRFESKTPRGAGLKAARRLFKEAPPSKREIRFTIREITRGSEGKEFTYIGVKRMLEDAVEVKDKNGVVLYTVTHEFSIRSCKK